MNETNGTWLSILAYAAHQEISISTIRRYIKSNRVRYKQENGKYFIFIEDKNNSRPSDELVALQQENLNLRNTVKLQQQELEDLKMLISLYENNHHQAHSLPPVPPIFEQEC